MGVAIDNATEKSRRWRNRVRIIIKAEEDMTEKYVNVEKRENETKESERKNRGL